MTFQVGRTSLENAGRSKAGPRSVQLTGDQLAIAGVFYPDDPDTYDVRVFLQQWLGYNEENVAIPVVATAADWPMVTGFYHTRSATVEFLKGNTAEAGAVRYQYRGERVPGGFAFPRVEMTQAAAPRATGATYPGTWSRPTWVVPRNHYSTLWPDPDNIPTTSTGSPPKRGEHLYMLYDGIKQFNNVSTPFTSATLGYNIDPASYYDECACLEWLADDGSWYPIVGRQLPGDVHLSSDLNDNMNIRISTGVFRQIYAKDGDITSYHKAPDASSFLPFSYTDQGEFRFDSILNDVYNYTYVPLKYKIIRNDILACSVQFYLGRDDELNSNGRDTSKFGVIATATARRGHHFVDWNLLETYGTNDVRLQETGAGSCTTVNSDVIRQTSNDANGNRWIAASADANVVFSTSSSYIELQASSSYGFNTMIGIESGGSAAATYDAADYVGGQWWAATGDSHQVVAP